MELQVTLSMPDGPEKEAKLAEIAAKEEAAVAKQQAPEPES